MNTEIYTRAMFDVEVESKEFKHHQKKWMDEHNVSFNNEKVDSLYDSLNEFMSEESNVIWLQRIRFKLGLETIITTFMHTILTIDQINKQPSLLK